jgi:predicted O-methyltransferase YrrM
VVDERLQRYIEELFAVEDSVLARVRARHAEAGLPPIHISPDEGKLLHVLLRAAGARTVLEIGALAGYSGIWLARALPPEGRLTTIEMDRVTPPWPARHTPKPAWRGRSGCSGEARAVLRTLDLGFDAVFVDADKEPMAEYSGRACGCCVSAGLLLCDNAFSTGRSWTRVTGRPRPRGCARSTAWRRPTRRWSRR